jgi:hypothetical protein|tara:strand:- start:533 stop:730 length:198 start_codon:yes stop_codon:yes gene_type:complete
MFRRIDMLEIKSCPRCLGDLLTNRDMYGDYKQCLQCGFLRDLEPPVKPIALRSYAPESGKESDAA